MVDPAVIEYLQNVPAERQAMLMMMHELVLDLYPDCTVDMRYKMPTYHQGDGWVALANQKHYISLYTCGESPLRAFRQSQPKIKTGKGCINFNPNHILPMFDITEVVRHAMEHPEGE